jgi:hypothetical protein
MTTPPPPSASAAASAYSNDWVDTPACAEGRYVDSVYYAFLAGASWQRAQSAPLATITIDQETRLKAQLVANEHGLAAGVVSLLSPPAPIPSCCPRCRASLAFSCESCKLPFPPEQPPQEAPEAPKAHIALASRRTEKYVADAIHDARYAPSERHAAGQGYFDGFLAGLSQQSSVEWTESGPVFTCRTPDCASCDAERDSSPSSSASSFAEQPLTPPAAKNIEKVDGSFAERAREVLRPHGLTQVGPGISEITEPLIQDVAAFAQQVSRRERGEVRAAREGDGSRSRA